MKYVIDASTIIAVIAKEPERDALIEITKGADLIAPPSIHWEIGNAFSAMIKRGRVTKKQALDALAIYQTIPIRSANVELEDTLEIVSKYKIYAYDAYLLRCAQKYSSALLTLDAQLANIAQEMDLNIVEVPQ